MDATPSGSAGPWTVSWPQTAPQMLRFKVVGSSATATAAHGYMCSRTGPPELLCFGVGSARLVQRQCPAGPTKQQPAHPSSFCCRHKYAHSADRWLPQPNPLAAHSRWLPRAMTAQSARSGVPCPLWLLLVSGAWCVSSLWQRGQRAAGGLYMAGMHGCSSWVTTACCMPGHNIKSLALPRICRHARWPGADLRPWGGLPAVPVLERCGHC